MGMAAAKSYDAFDSDAVNVRPATDDLADCRDVVIADIVVIVNKGYKTAARSVDQRIALRSYRRLAIIAFMQYLDAILQMCRANLRG